MGLLKSVSLLPGTSLTEGGPELMVVEPPPMAVRSRIMLRGVTGGLRTALEDLRDAGAETAGLVARAMKSDGFAGAAKMGQYLASLGRHAMLRYHLTLDGQPFVTLRPLSPSYRHDDHRATPDHTYTLSRFAYCRTDGGGWLLECPRGHAAIQLHAPAAQRLLHELARPSTAATLADASGLDAEGTLQFLNLLANAEALAPADPGQPCPETDDPTLAAWEFHDLLYHSRSRLGRHDNPYGGTYPFKDRFPFLPVVKPEASTERIPLYRPDLERLQREDLPFTQVLEARSSLRDPGDPPLSVEQLGEFLYRSARIKKMVEVAGVSFRPSPGGGALHELEIYPLVRICTGLEPGLYHYNPLEHALYRLTEATLAVNGLVEMARITSDYIKPPQVVLVLAARFQRLQLKYRSVAYAVTLKNVGALYQTMYLVATAMGLAPCGLGGGHSDLFAQATGLDYFAETSVGEFLLSSRGNEEPHMEGKAR
jgi:SagB-type dehydrogenase family enzyme